MLSNPEVCSGVLPRSNTIVYGQSTVTTLDSHGYYNSLEVFWESIHSALTLKNSRPWTAALESEYFIDTTSKPISHYRQNHLGLNLNLQGNGDRDDNGAKFCKFIWIKFRSISYQHVFIFITVIKISSVNRFL